MRALDASGRGQDRHAAVCYVSIMHFASILALSALATAACVSTSNDGPGADAGTPTTGQDAASEVDASLQGPDGASASNDGASTSDGNPAFATGCQANCAGKTCGDDGCKGTCGSCPPSELCGPSGACQTVASASTVVVDANSQRTVISPAIYGVAANSDDSVAIATLNRWGGDSTSSYNWKTDTFNSGADWNCANYQGFFTSPTPSPAFTSSADQFVNYNGSKHLDSLMTIPLSGWVANQQTASTSLATCAGATRDTTTCCTEIGSSESIQVDKGSANLDPSYMGDWVRHLATTFGTADNGGVKYYQLDNEPDNWQGLRLDIYPSLYPPGTFCEPFYTTIPQVGASINQDFINRTMAYSAAIKAADPAAQVLFMSMESPVDLVSLNSDECAGTGSDYTLNSSLTAAILALGAQHEASTQQRILDCVDTHYPVTSTGLDATRAIWDPTTTSVFPHIQDWVNATYPGTGICVSEYNWPNDGTNGAAADPTTGTLEADLLGMFGRFGIRVAAYWTTLVSGSTHLPVYNAMAMYRNYDGQGGHFGTYSIGAASSNSGVHAFAAADAATSPSTLWVMLVNVSGQPQNDVSVAVQNFVPGATAEVFQMTNGAAPTAAPNATINSGTVSGLALPSGSVTLVVIGK